MKRGSRHLALALVAFAAAWAIARASGWGPLQLVAGVALADLVPGLALLRLAGARRRDWLETLVIAGILSPPLVAALAALAAIALRGAPLAGLGAVALGICAVIAGWPARATERPGVSAVPTAGGGRAAGAAIALGVLSALLVAIGFLRPYVRNWSDAWFHAAVFQEVARAGLPPDFPHFAGHALPYPWFFHVYLVGASAVIARDPIVLIAGLNVWTALLFPPALYLLARRLGLGPGAASGSSLAGVLGVNPLGPVYLFAPAFLGHMRDPQVLAHALHDTDSTMWAMVYGFMGFHSSLFARWWTPTAFDFGLLLALLVLGALVALWERPGARATLALAGSLVLLLLWHSLIMIHLAFGMVVAVVAGTLVAPGLARRAALARAGLVALALGAAYVVARPYLAQLTAGSGSGQLVHVAPLPRNLYGLVFSMGPVALAGAFGWRAVKPALRPLLGALTLALVVPYLGFDLPGIADEKLYYPLFLPLAAMAGAALVWGWQRALVLRAALVLLALGGLANVALTARGFLGDPRPVRHLFAPGDEARAPFLTADEDAVLAWLRAATPREAVVLQFPRVSGPEPVLVVGQRRLFLGTAESFYRATFFPDSARPPAPPAAWAELVRRRALLGAAFSARPLAPDTLRLLRAYPWPLLVWWDPTLGGGTLSPTLAPGAGVTRTVFATPTVRLLAVERAAR